MLGLWGTPQGDVSVGTLEPAPAAAVESAPEDEARLQSNAGASTSGTSCWGDSLHVRTLESAVEDTT